MLLDNGYFGLYKGQSMFLCDKELLLLIKDYLSDNVKTNMNIDDKDIKLLIVDKLNLILNGGI